MVALKEKPMARKGERRDDKTIKVERNIVTKLAFVADRRGVSVAELASDILRDPADKLWREELARFQAGQEPGDGSKRKKGGGA